MSKTKPKPTGTAPVARYWELRRAGKRWLGRRIELGVVAELIPLLPELRSMMRSMSMDAMPLGELERALRAGHFLTTTRGEACAALLHRVDAIVEELAERVAEAAPAAPVRVRPPGCPSGYERLSALLVETSVSKSTAHDWITREAVASWKDDDTSERWVDAKAFRTKAAIPRRSGRPSASR